MFLTEPPHSLSYPWSHPPIHHPCPEISITPVQVPLIPTTSHPLSTIIKTVNLTPIRLNLNQTSNLAWVSISIFTPPPPNLTFLHWKILGYNVNHQSRPNQPYLNSTYLHAPSPVLPNASLQPLSFQLSLKKPAPPVRHCWPPPMSPVHLHGALPDTSLPWPQSLPALPYPVTVCPNYPIFPIPILSNPFSSSRQIQGL